MRARLLIAAFGLLASACSKNDLGQTCLMTWACDAGSCAIPADRVSNTQLDYIAFGVAECLDLTCLRTKNTTNPDSVNGNATGYCSSPCLSDSDCNPSSSSVPSMHCEQLLPDETFVSSGAQGPESGAKYCIRQRQ